MKILIAEDDRVSRETQKEILSLFGRVDSVVNGAEAAQKVKNALEIFKPYNFVFLDINMPFYDGKYALEKIREIEETYKIAKDKKAKIIIVTSSQSRADIMHFKGQCDGYLLKPISPDSIKKIFNHESQQV